MKRNSVEKSFSFQILNVILVILVILGPVWSLVPDKAKGVAGVHDENLQVRPSLARARVTTHVMARAPCERSDSL